MSISRWKIMTAFLGLSVGGLAVCTGQQTPPPILPSPPKITAASDPFLPLPSVPQAKPALFPPESLPPTIKPDLAKEIEIVLPILTPPMEFVPVKAEELVTQPRTKADEKKNPTTLEVPALNGSYDPPPQLNLTSPATKPVAVEAVKPPVQVAPPPVDFEIVAPKSPAPIVDVTPSKPIPMPKPEVAAPSKLKLLVRLGSGTPRFEVRSTVSEEVVFKVYGEKIDIQGTADKTTPLSGVSASGKVRFSGPGVEGTCDGLTFLSGTGEVLLKGNVQMKTKRGKASSELTADKMIYQIGVGSGTTASASTGGSSPISPAVFRE